MHLQTSDDSAGSHDIEAGEFGYVRWMDITRIGPADWEGSGTFA